VPLEAYVKKEGTLSDEADGHHLKGDAGGARRSHVSRLPFPWPSLAFSMRSFPLFPSPVPSRDALSFLFDHISGILALFEFSRASWQFSVPLHAPGPSY